MKAFKDILLQKLSSNFYNNYGNENYDEHRFGQLVNETIPVSQKIKDAAKKLIRFKIKNRVNAVVSGIEGYEERIQRIYDQLNSSDKALMIGIIAFPLLNIKLHHINTSLNPHLKDRIALIENPVADISDLKIIYHSMEDFVNIPLWIADLNLDYELFIGHYTIHAEETICFAKPKIAHSDTYN